MSLKKGLLTALVVLSGVSTAQAATDGAAETTKFRKETKEMRHMEVQSKSKSKAPAPTPATEQGLSNVERVNRALNPGPSNPDVPLPHPDLANPGSSRQDTSAAPQIYGRQEEGGGVLGLRMPIPASRSAPAAGTRSSSP